MTTTTQDRISQLETEMDSLIDKIKEIQTESINKGLSWDEYQNAAKQYIKAHSAKSRELRTLVVPVMEAIPKYGDHMTLKDFIKNVKSGGFIDYDGSGNYATETQMSDITIYPSDINSGVYRKDFSHIVWFNR